MTRSKSKPRSRKTAIDHFTWMLITFIAGNTLWMIATCIPVMYRKDLYQYPGKEEENGKQ